MTYLELDELESFGTGNLFESLKLLPHGDSETGEVGTKVLSAMDFYALTKKTTYTLVCGKNFSAGTCLAMTKFLIVVSGEATQAANSSSLLSKESPTGQIASTP